MTDTTGNTNDAPAPQGPAMTLKQRLEKLEGATPRDDGRSFVAWRSLVTRSGQVPTGAVHIAFTLRQRHSTQRAA